MSARPVQNPRLFRGRTVSREPLTILLNPKLRAELERIADELNLSLGEVVRQALEFAFEQDQLAQADGSEAASRTDGADAPVQSNGATGSAARSPKSNIKTARSRSRRASSART